MIDRRLHDGSISFSGETGLVCNAKSPRFPAGFRGFGSLLERNHTTTSPGNSRLVRRRVFLRSEHCELRMTQHLSVGNSLTSAERALHAEREPLVQGSGDDVAAR